MNRITSLPVCPATTEDRGRAGGSRGDGAAGARPSARAETEAAHAGSGRSAERRKPPVPVAAGGGGGILTAAWEIHGIQRSLLCLIFFPNKILLRE